MIQMAYFSELLFWYYHYIVNKFKVSEMRYEDINEIGRKHE